MANFDDNVNLLARAFNAARFAGMRRAKTGKYDPDSDSIIASEDDLPNNKVWIRFKPKGAAVDAWNIGANKVPIDNVNLDVWVGNDPKGELTILGLVNTDIDTAYSEQVAQVTQAPTIIDSSKVSIDKEAINILKPSRSPSGGLKVRIGGYFSAYGNWIEQDIDFSGRAPGSTGVRRWVVAYLDTSDMAVKFVNGSDIDSLSISTNDLANIAIPALGIRIAAMNMVNGMTTYSDSELVDIRDFLNPNGIALTLEADSGTPEIVANGDTITIAGGDAIDTVISPDDTITVSVSDSGITTAKINNIAVTTDKIASGAVTGIKIANNSIDSNHILDSAVTTNKIANSAVLSAKIANGNVTEAKIADGAVTNAKIGETISVANGGTGATTPSGARTNLGLVIGTDVQAWDADLDTWATKTAPSGTVVGTTDTQTLSGKTLSAPLYSGNGSGQLNIDNLRLDDNTLSSTNTNGSIDIVPNGSGAIRAQGSTVSVGASNNNGLSYFQSLPALHLCRTAAASLFLSSGGASGKVASFFRNQLEIGDISVTSTVCSFNSTSDRRLKENIVDASINDAVNKLLAIPVKLFNFKSDKASTQTGFIADELQDVVPEAVTGEPDAIQPVGTITHWTTDDNDITRAYTVTNQDIPYDLRDLVKNGKASLGDTDWMQTGTRPIYQGVDASKLMPTVVAALQGALQRIEQLEARISALEAKQ